MIVLSRKVFIRILSFSLAIFIVTFGFFYKELKEKNYYINQTQHIYSRNFEDLSSCLNNIDVTLEKVLYSASAVELGSLAAELWKESGSAKIALSQLPKNEEELETINKFLSQVGDYSLFLAKKMIVENEITSSERENVRKLSLAARGISNSVSEAMTLYSDGYWTEEIVSELNDNYISNFGESLLQIDDTVTDYPTLIYDGPYSDHILTSTPKMTENAVAISADEAAEKAAKTLGVSKEILGRRSDEQSRMPCYCFGTDDAEISITMNGGYIADYRKFRAIGDAKISYEEAVEIATEYISILGYSFKPTYYFADEGMCTVNLAYYDGDRIYYPDLIKVGVSMDNGEILMVESRGFLANHYDRKFDDATASVDEAKSVLSENLTVVSSKEVVIPTNGKNEKLCYEFLCYGYDEREILVYIDAYTLQENDILILLRTDGGTMTK